MSTHNLCFKAKIRKKHVYLVNPNCTILKRGARGINYTGMLS